MQFLRQKKKSIVANGERIWEGDPRYEELTRPKKNPSEDEKEKAEIDEVLEEQWKEDRAKILSFFTPMLFAKVAAWVAVFYYLSPVARPALVFLTLFVLIFWNLGKRKKGEMSAYNIFNPNYGRIGGDNLVQQFQAQFLNRPQQNDAQPARQRQTASGGTEQDSDSDEDIDIDSLKPRDKVVVVTRQGGRLKQKTMKWKHAEVFVRTEGWTVLEVLKSRTHGDADGIEVVDSGTS